MRISIVLTGGVPISIRIIKIFIVSDGLYLILMLHMYCLQFSTRDVLSRGVSRTSAFLL